MNGNTKWLVGLVGVMVTAALLGMGTLIANRAMSAMDAGSTRDAIHQEIPLDPLIQNHSSRIWELEAQNRATNERLEYIKETMGMVNRKIDRLLEN